jgi:tRNA pseudouridine65 synthase
MKSSFKSLRSGYPKIDMKTIYRDRYFIVVHKPSGMTVYGEPSPGEKSAYDILKSSLRLEHLYPVHRLDKGTCGLLIFAFDPKVASLLERDFREAKIKKKYWALVFGETATKGVNQDPILSNKTKQKQSALTRFKRLGLASVNEEAVSWVECEPETGRYHQIRRHMKGLHHVLVGDKEYGGEKRMEWVKKNLGLKRIALSSVEIAFQHPVTKRKMVLQTRPDHALDVVIRSIFESEH